MPCEMLVVSVVVVLYHNVSFVHIFSLDEGKGTYSFANTPFSAAKVPLARARTSHVRDDFAIFESFVCFGAFCRFVWSGKVLILTHCKLPT